MNLDDFCRDSGGAWCTADSLWQDGPGKAALVVIICCIVGLVLLALRFGARSVMSLRKEKHVEVE